jgi:Coenzyme PQQ synthesis protein D (PqqD)
MAVTRPRIREEITVCGIDGEAVVYDPDGSELHYLNHSAALVLDLCDGETSMKQMSTAIADVYEMAAADVEKQVRSTVRQLQARNLLVPTKQPATGNVASNGSGKSAQVEIDLRELVRLQVPRSS